MVFFGWGVRDGGGGLLIFTVLLRFLISRKIRTRFGKRGVEKEEKGFWGGLSVLF